jgi:hypothetical protein
VAASAVICLGWLALNRRPRLFLVVLFSLIVANIAFWAVIGQSPAALPGYYLSQLALSAPYSEAMAQTGNERIFLFIAAAFVTLFLFSHLATRKTADLSVARLLFALFLFMSFKAGFTRQDAHQLIGAAALLMTPLVLPLALPTALRPWRTGVLFAICAALCLVGGYSIQRKYSVSTYDFAWSQIRGGYAALFSHLKNPEQNARAYEEFRKRLSGMWPLPTLSGSSDLYSVNQGWLLASDNLYNPRPIPQSYSAYSKRLAFINRDHLRAETAPDNIFFAIQPIDKHLPALEDGASWPLIWSRYRMEGEAKGYLLFRKKSSSGKAAETGLWTGKGAFDRPVAVPPGERMIMAEIVLKPSLFGKVMGILLRLPELQMLLELSDGRFIAHRFIASTAETPFLLSPYVGDGNDFAAVTRVAQGIPMEDDEFSLVRSFRIVAEAKSSWWTRVCWQKIFTVKLTALEGKIPKIQIYRPPTVAEMPENLPELGRVSGVIDDITLKNEAGFAALFIAGWLTGQTPPPGSSFFVNIGGQRQLLSRATSPDYFATGDIQPSLVQSAFRGVVFLPDLPDGRHNLTIEAVDQDGTGFRTLTNHADAESRPSDVWLVRKGDEWNLKF